MTEHYDAIVIGAGQAGPSLAARLDREGLKTAIIERHLMGGTCVNTGCIPTKTLVASARVAYLSRRAADYGVKIDTPVSVDMARVKARKDEIVAASNTGVTAWVEDMQNVTLNIGINRIQGSKVVGHRIVVSRIQYVVEFYRIFGKAWIALGVAGAPEDIVVPEHDFE